MLIPVTIAFNVEPSWQRLSKDWLTFGSQINWMLITDARKFAAVHCRHCTEPHVEQFSTTVQIFHQPASHIIKPYQIYGLAIWNLISHFYSFSFYTDWMVESHYENWTLGSLNYGINTICPHLLFYALVAFILCDPNSSGMEKQINSRKLHWLWFRHKHNTTQHIPTQPRKKELYMAGVKNVRVHESFSV